MCSKPTDPDTPEPPLASSANASSPPSSASAMPPTEDTDSIKAIYTQSKFWSVMYGTGEAIFGLFATRTRMPTQLFGHMAGLASLFGPLLQVFSAGLVEKHERRKSFVLVGVGAQVICYLALAGIAASAGWWMKDRPERGMLYLPYLIFIAVTTIYAMSGHFMNPPWTSLVGDTVPEAGRTRFYSRQTRLIWIGVLLTQTVVMVILNLTDGEGNGDGLADPSAGWGNIPQYYVFAFLFLVAMMMRSLSFNWIMHRIREPQIKTQPDTYFSFWQFLKRGPKSNFVHFVVFFAVVSFGTNLSAPYFLPYFRYQLHYKEWHWLLVSAATLIGSIVAVPFWAKLADRFGNKRLLTYSGYLVVIIPLLWMCSARLEFLILFELASGMAWSGFNMGIWNYVLEAATPPKRPRCVAYSSIIFGLGAFVGAEVGGWLLGRLELRYTGAYPFLLLLAISAVMRLFAIVVFAPTFKELRKQPPGTPSPRWFFREIQIRPLGLWSQFFGGHEKVPVSDDSPGAPSDAERS